MSSLNTIGASKDTSSVVAVSPSKFSNRGASEAVKEDTNLETNEKSEPETKPFLESHL